mmetsp:Transcript_66258/g.156478  ORF Transcript_66258/g.156478 Transcript_66258/m.156478 type:complete len:252 (+) Transcript_66258:17-772(+)
MAAKRTQEAVNVQVWKGLHAVFGAERVIRLIKWGLPSSYGQVVFQSDTKDHVFLTIDDAPGDPEGMRHVLDSLAETGAKATFFVIGSFVSDERRAIMERLLQEGHHVGNHLMEDRSALRMSEEEFEKALLECQDVLLALDPAFNEAPVKWFRPPMGHLAKWMVPILERHRYTIALGNVYPNDCAVQTQPHFISDFVIRHAAPGAIVIVHCPDNGREAQSGVIQRILSHWRTNDFSVVSLKEFLTVSESAAS